MPPVNLEEQVEPGTFVYALHHLIEARCDDTFLAEEFSNDETGRPAYPSKLLLKAIFFDYPQGIHSSRKIERACKFNICFMALLRRLGFSPGGKTHWTQSHRNYLRGLKLPDAAQGQRATIRAAARHAVLGQGPLVEN